MASFPTIPDDVNQETKKCWFMPTFADVNFCEDLNDDSSEEEDSDVGSEECSGSESDLDEEDQSEATTSKSFGGSTTGISSMNSSEHLRAVNSNCTLDSLFEEQMNKEIKDLELLDEGLVLDASIEKPLDVDVNFVINLNNQVTPQALQTPVPQTTPICDPNIQQMQSILQMQSIQQMQSMQSIQQMQESQAYTPLKHYLKPICTIGTGTFGRVELTQHKETKEYYALKSMYIPSILERRQLSHVFNEKRILSKLEHPFIVKLFDTAKDSRYLYLIMDYLAGGELFSYLRMTRTLPSPIVKFYAAEVLLALGYLHSLHIAFRDLKPENLMLDREGNIKLTDFGFAKEIHSVSFSLCGTSEYLAPELANRKGHNVTVDFWSLGVLIFELIAGFTPFAGSCVDEVQACIQETQGHPDFPHKTFSANAKSIISQLLSIDPVDRKSAPEIMKHPWFAEIQFDKLLAKKVKPLIIPTLHDPGDTGNFDSYEEADKQPPAKQRDLDLFDEW